MRKRIISIVDRYLSLSLLSRCLPPGMSCGRQQERRKNLPAKQQINVWPGSSFLSCERDSARPGSVRSQRMLSPRTGAGPERRRHQTHSSLSLEFTRCAATRDMGRRGTDSEETLARVLASGECSPPQVSSPPWQRLNGDLSPFSCHG